MTSVRANQRATMTAMPWPEALVMEPGKTSVLVKAAGRMRSGMGIRLRMMQDPSQETVTLRHGAADRALPLRQHGAFLPGTGVGGAGEHWSGIAYRYLPDVFELLTRTREKYGERRLPEGHAIEIGRASCRERVASS